MNYLKQLRHAPVKLYNPETISYRDRVLAAGGTLSTRTLDAIEKFVRDCKNALIWDKLLDAGPMAGSNLNAALVKLVTPSGVASSLTNVNFVSGDYIETGSSAGLLGDGATKYLNTGFNAQVHLPDDCHLSFYLRDDVLSAGNRVLLGATVSNDQYWLGSLTPATQTNTRLGQLLTATRNQSMSKGFYAGSRTSSGLLTLYRNGAAVASDSSTVVHNKPNQNIYLLAMNSSGAAAAFTGARCGFYSIGLGLDATEAAALNDAVQTLQRNLDRQVS